MGIRRDDPAGAGLTHWREAPRILCTWRPVRRQETSGAA